MGEHSRIWAAQRRAAASASPSGTTSLTKPSAWPSAAETRRPVRIMPSAAFCPVIRGRRWTPLPAMRPTRGSGSAKTAFSAAMMMSQASAVSNPPPIATPLTAAMRGLSRSKRWLSPANPVAGRGPRRPAAWTLRSLPAENARSPAPVMIPTQRSGLAANSFHTWSNSQCASLCKAFITSGRLIVTMRRRPSSATVQKRYSVIGGAFSGGVGRE